MRQLIIVIDIPEDMTEAQAERAVDDLLQADSCIDDRIDDAEYSVFVRSNV